MAKKKKAAVEVVTPAPVKKAKKKAVVVPMKPATAEALVMVEKAVKKMPVMETWAAFTARRKAGAAKILAARKLKATKKGPKA